MSGIPLILRSRYPLFGRFFSMIDMIHRTSYMLPITHMVHVCIANIHLHVPRSPCQISTKVVKCPKLSRQIINRQSSTRKLRKCLRFDMVALNQTTKTCRDFSKRDPPHNGDPGPCELPRNSYGSCMGGWGSHYWGVPGISIHW